MYKMLQIIQNFFQSILFQRNIFQFYIMSKKSQGVISYANLDIFSAFLNIQTCCLHIYLYQNCTNGYVFQKLSKVFYSNLLFFKFKIPCFILS